MSAEQLTRFKLEEGNNAVLAVRKQLLLMAEANDDDGATLTAIGLIETQLDAIDVRNAAVNTPIQL